MESASLSVEDEGLFDVICHCRTAKIGCGRWTLSHFHRVIALMITRSGWTLGLAVTALAELGNGETGVLHTLRALVVCRHCDSDVCDKSGFVGTIAVA